MLDVFYITLKSESEIISQISCLDLLETLYLNRKIRGCLRFGIQKESKPPFPDIFRNYDEAECDDQLQNQEKLIHAG